MRPGDVVQVGEDGPLLEDAEIAELMEARKKAIEAGDQATRCDVEAKLYDRNPRYFSYLKLDERIRALRTEG